MICIVLHVGFNKIMQTYSAVLLSLYFPTVIYEECFVHRNLSESCHIKRLYIVENGRKNIHKCKNEQLWKLFFISYKVMHDFFPKWCLGLHLLISWQTYFMITQNVIFTLEQKKGRIISHVTVHNP